MRSLHLDFLGLLRRGRGLRGGRTCFHRGDHSKVIHECERKGSLNWPKAQDFNAPLSEIRATKTASNIPFHLPHVNTENRLFLPSSRV